MSTASFFDEVALYLLQKETITGDELMTYVNAEGKRLDAPASEEAAASDAARFGGMPSVLPRRTPDSHFPLFNRAACFAARFFRERPSGFQFSLFLKESEGGSLCEIFSFLSAMEPLASQVADELSENAEQTKIYH
ncbi:MAG: hypothetical protein ACLUN5_15170 [Oscillospiraceae bacterium]